MAKAINWPAQYRAEILNEALNRACCAVRLGTLYLDPPYWVPEEEVDLRAGGLVVRRGVVQGELKGCLLGELTPDDLTRLRSDLTTHQALITFLQRQYNQPVSLQSPVTVVYYRNLPVDKDRIELPKS